MSINACRWIFLVVVFYAALSLTVSAKPAEDPLACEPSITGAVIEVMHKSDNDLYLSSCRRDPVQTSHWIVNLLSPSAGNTDDETWYDVDVVIWDANKKRVVAHLKQARAVLSAIPELRSTSIDTGRYILADGVRALGVRYSYYPRCHDCDFSETYLTLYVQRKDKIERLFSTRVEQTTSGDDASVRCRDSIHTIRTTITPGDRVSHGLRDLIIVTRSADEIPVVPGQPPGFCSPPLIETRVVPYDGTSYGTLEPSRPD